MRGRIRPLTASHGLGLSLSANQMTGNRVRECMGGCQRPNSASHRLGLTRERPWEAEFSLSSPRPHRICHVICLSQSESPICEADRPLTHAKDRTALPAVRERPISLTDLRVRSVSPIGLSRTPGDAMRLAVKSVRRPWGSDCIARCAWEADRTHRSDSHGLTDRPHRSDSHGLPHGLTDHRSDSLTDLTMWQIWQIHFIAI